MKIITVKLSELVPNPAQPPQRTAPARIMPMVESLSQHGQLMPIQVQSLNGTAVPGKRWMIVTGHTRCAAAESLGWTDVLAIPLEPTDSPEQSWGAEASVTRRISGPQWFTAWAQLPRERQSAFLRTITPHFAFNIEKMVKIFGHTRTVELGLLKDPVQPNIANNINRVYTNLRKYAPSPVVTLREVGEWMVDRTHTPNLFTGTFEAVAATAKRPWQRLARAIKTDVPHTRGSW